ncbi:hypothetical protein [Streptomyces tibetensis]|uniref:hypothetical protein n=1 Tax=Streptomyces tibetensis TaxID=2382123 RepID=UPI0033F32829
MGIIAWSDMASRDLRDASNDPAVRFEFLDLAEKELRYPPLAGPDEGFTVQYDRGFAYRRALRRSAPARSADLRSDPDEVDQDPFPFGDYYYVYRRPMTGETVSLGQRGQAARLHIARLLHLSQMLSQLEV